MPIKAKSKVMCNCLTHIKGGSVRPCKAFALKYSPACVTHSRINAIKIQSVWRGYRTRGKIKLLKKLPYDVLTIVQYYMRYDHNVQRKLFRSHLNIYNNRCNKYSHYYHFWKKNMLHVDELLKLYKLPY